MAPSRARLWRYRFRLAGKEGTFAVGAFPEMGLADATVFSLAGIRRLMLLATVAPSRTE